MNLISYSTHTDFESTNTSVLPDWARTKKPTGSFVASLILSNKLISTTESESSDNFRQFSFRPILQSTKSNFPKVISNESNEASSRSDIIMSNLCFAIEENNPLSALNEILELIKSNEGLQVLIKNIREDYSSLIDLALAQKMFGVAEILEYYKKLELFEVKSATFISSRKLANSRQVTESIKSHTIDSTNETRFLNMIKKFGKKDKFDDQQIKNLVNTYPFFTNERSLFKCLSEFKYKHKAFVITFLNTLALEGFPNGIENAISAENEIADLKVKFPLSPILDINILKNMSIKQNNLDDILKFKGDKDFLSYYKADEIAKAITTRDACIVQSIGLSHISHSLHKGISHSPILILERIFQNTISSIALEIVKNLDQEDRENVINKFLKVGAILLKNKNLHGALQLALALSHDAVCRLFTTEQISSPIYQNLLELKRSYSQNTNELKNNTDRELLIPITGLFWTKLRSTYMEISGFENVKLKAKHLKNLESEVLCLMNFRSACQINLLWEEKNNLAKFLCNFQKIPDDVIETYSSLCKKSIKLVNFEVSLRKWTPTHFMNFLENEILGDLKMENLLRQEIYNGEIFIEKFSKNQKIIKNWSEDAQAVILELYLKSRIDL